MGCNENSLVSFWFSQKCPGGHLFDCLSLGDCLGFCIFLGIEDSFFGIPPTITGSVSMVDAADTACSLHEFHTFRYVVLVQNPCSIRVGAYFHSVSYRLAMVFITVVMIVLMISASSSLSAIFSFRAITLVRTPSKSKPPSSKIMA